VTVAAGLFCLGPLIYLLQNTFKLFAFPISCLLAFLIKAVEETHHATNFVIYIFSTIAKHSANTSWCNVYCHGRDRMVVGFTTTYAISAYHHWCCGFDSRSGWGVQHYV